MRGWRVGRWLLPFALACARPSAPGAQSGPAHAEVAATASSRTEPAAAAPQPTAPSAAPCERNPLLQVVGHDIELDVSLEPRVITGKGTLRVQATAPTALIALDARGLELSRFALGSALLATERAGDLVCATLPEPLVPGREQALELEWRVGTRGPMPSFAPGAVWAGYRASAWMPTLDDAAQRASLTLHVIAREGLKVGASGRSLGPRVLPGARVRHDFVLDERSPPFLYAFAVGRFDEAELRVDDVRLRAFGPAGADLSGALRATGAMYHFLVGKLGLQHPWHEYLQVFVPDADAAQEAAGMALIGSQALQDLRSDPRDDWVFMHELAHQWFAWLVSCADFSDFWLNEGFATFMVGAFKEAHWGGAAYEREVANWRQRSAAAHAADHDAPIALSSSTGAWRPAPRDFELQVRGVTYFRGALALRRLRAELGDEGFWRGLRAYVAAYAGKAARTSDLRRSLEASSGRDLGPFFDKWIYSSAQP